uniref:SH2 domain-containing protein n=1 Tax=Glossina morsitans morsitans TaxID=37546 RepID=A0A1B0FHY1_GLOMM
MKLTKEHCQSIWKAGSIVGFISKPKADEILRQSPTGTFLLRFSDSELGQKTIKTLCCISIIIRSFFVDGITLTVTSKQNSVLILKPWTPRDRGFADRIHDIPFLLRVYPSNRARNDASGEFYRERQS